MQDASTKDLIELIARALVDHPDEVSVQELQDGATIVIELRVAERELGKVIGKQGRTARAIRTILAAAGAKSNRRFVLEIID